LETWHVELAALYYRVNRPEDGAREKKIVDRLTEEERPLARLFCF